jgi:hypothetical protein
MALRRSSHICIALRWLSAYIAGLGALTLPGCQLSRPPFPGDVDWALAHPCYPCCCQGHRSLCDTELSIQVHHSFKHAFCLDYTKSTPPKSLHGRRVCCSLIFIAHVVTYIGMGMDLCKRSPVKLQNVVTRLASHQASTPCPDLHSKLANDPANTTVRLMYKERNVPDPTVRYHTEQCTCFSRERQRIDHHLPRTLLHCTVIDLQ